MSNTNMNLAILTIQSFNFGNRLQNYALQEVLRNMGHKVYTLNRSHLAPATQVKRIIRQLVRHDSIAETVRFNRRYIRFAKDIVTQDYVSTGLANRYDCFVIGSDQVWNPTFSFNGENDFLPFVPREKKLAYAASFGVKSISENREKIALLLEDIPAISMREEAGSIIVHELTDRYAPVVLDPTMLLARSQWTALARRPNIDLPEGPYVLQYLLGNADSDALETDIANRLGIPIIRVSFGMNPVGPAEFIWLILHAGAICTDSFHGAVFSLLFHKPLAIIERVSDLQDMTSRIVTLCTTFGIMSNCTTDTSFDVERVIDMDWSAIESRLQDKRKFSLNFLKEAVALHG